jgi:lipoprotein NlpD
MLERMPLLLLTLVVLLAGCASSKNRAPVEERAASPRPAASSSAEPAAAAPAADAKPMLNAEHAGKPGYYTVKPGDTLIRIGLENGQNWRDVARWNGIENPNLLEVGQVLRVVAPSVDPNAVAARGVTPTKVEPRPLDAKPPAAAASATAAASAPAAAPAASAPATTVAAPAATAKDPDDDLGWLWPASGPVASGFEEGRSKGVAITGKAGDPVLAAADGRVVYAGSGLRGYGNLVIVKHNNTYLTAYAHNQTLLVKEDQVVRRGQRIAEMGSSDSDRVQLHFEIRKQGKPVDPQRLLPPR